jgi:hypothetical protein
VGWLECLGGALLATDSLLTFERPPRQHGYASFTRLNGAQLFGRSHGVPHGGRTEEMCAYLRFWSPKLAVLQFSQ